MSENSVSSKRCVFLFAWQQLLTKSKTLTERERVQIPLRNEPDSQVCVFHLQAPESERQLTESGPSCLSDSTIAGDSGEGTEWELGAGFRIDAEEDAIKRDRTVDKARAASSHQEFGEARFGTQKSPAQASIPRILS